MAEDIQNWVDYYEKDLAMHGEKYLLAALEEKEALLKIWEGHMDTTTLKATITAIKIVLKKE